MDDGLARLEEKNKTMLRGFFEPWIERKNAWDGRMLEDSSTITDRVVCLSDEWKLIDESGGRTTTNLVDAHWSQRELGWVKANADANRLKVQDFGGVLWDDSGGFLLVLVTFLPPPTIPS